MHIRWNHLAAVALGVFTLTGVSSCNGLEMQSTWTEKPITVDGKVDDWRGIGSALLEENEASVGLANDSSRLYVLVRLRDRRTAGMIRRSGLTLYIDPEGGKSKDFYICFHGGPSREDIEAMGGDGDRRPSDRENDFMAPDTGRPEFTCYQKGRIVEMEIPTDGSLGPAAAYGVDQGLYTYEFSIPLQESTVRFYGIGAEPGRKIGLGAKWGGGGRGGMSGPRMHGGGMPPMGGGGDMPPGGMGGGPRGGGPGDGEFGKRPDRPKEQEVWLKVPLAKATAAEH